MNSSTIINFLTIRSVISRKMPAVLLLMIFYMPGFSLPDGFGNTRTDISISSPAADNLTEISEKAGSTECTPSAEIHEYGARHRTENGWVRYSYEQFDKLIPETISNRIFFLPEIDFERSSGLIRVLVVVIIYSIISMIILLFVILFHRNYMERESRVRQKLKEKYQLLLMDYLFNDEEHPEMPGKINKIAADKYNREILMDEMKDLIVNLSGDYAASLRELYYSIGLDKDSLRKAYSNKWHVKIKGYRELAFMNLKRANDEITRSLHHNNSILRMEAQLSLVRLNDENRFSFLDEIQRPFTKWEQMNVHEMIVNYNLEVPDFQKWLNSENPSVIIFALSMIRVFKQKHAIERVIETLENEDARIRATAIEILGELSVKQAVVPLKNRYKHEVYENQLAILVALNKISDKSAAKFLVMVIDKEDDVQLQIEAAKALRDMGEPGQMSLEKLMQSDYKNYMIIIKHVLDKRI